MPATTPHDIARAFHEAYERLAPEHSYTTRAASAVQWEHVPESNKGLMVATVAALLEQGTISAGPANDPPEELHERLAAALDTMVYDLEASRALASAVLPLFAEEHERARQAEQGEFSAEKRAEQAAASAAEVYRERAQLVAFLAAQYPSVMAYADPDEPDWAVVYVLAPAGQMSWHIAPGDMDLFRHVTMVTPDDQRAQWDGHDTDLKYERLGRMTRFSSMTHGKARP